MVVEGFGCRLARVTGTGSETMKVRISQDGVGPKLASAPDGTDLN